MKHVSDTELGIPSQCFVAKPAGVGYGNYPRGLPQVSSFHSLESLQNQDECRKIANELSRMLVTAMVQLALLAR